LKVPPSNQKIRMKKDLLELENFKEVMKISVFISSENPRWYSKCSIKRKMVLFVR